VSAKLCIAVILLTSVLQAAEWNDPQTWIISVKALPLKSDQRVIGYRAKIISGSIISLTKIPPGWDFVLHNNENWITDISASIRVGAAAFDPDGSKDNFRDFMVIRKLKMPAEFKHAPFDIHFEINVTTDFEHQEWISIPLKDLSIERSAK